MSIILMTTLFYKALILQGEIWCWSLLGLKGLRNNYIIFCKKYVVKFLKKKFKNCVNYLRKQENNVLKENIIIITFSLIDLEAVSNLMANLSSFLAVKW